MAKSSRSVATRVVDPTLTVRVEVTNHARKAARDRIGCCPHSTWWLPIAEGIVLETFQVRKYDDGTRVDGTRGYIVPTKDSDGTEIDLVVAAKNVYAGNGVRVVTIVTVYVLAINGERVPWSWNGAIPA